MGAQYGDFAQSTSCNLLELGVVGCLGVVRQRNAGCLDRELQVLHTPRPRARPQAQALHVGAVEEDI